MNGGPDWTLYRTFLAVAQDGSLSAAARRLQLTQPTIARHIEALEAHLGADLFLRSQRGMAPTALGQALLPHAEALAATTAAMLRQATSAGAAIAGTVRISVGEVIGLERLPAILAGLAARHSHLALEVVVSDGLHDLLRRDADIAVRQSEPAQAALLARKLPGTELGLLAHETYLARRGRPAALADLAAHDLIGWDADTPVTRALAARFPGLARAGFRFRTDSNAAQLALIRAGCGIGMSHVGLAREEPGLQRLLAGAVSAELPLWIVMHEDLRSTPACRAVFDALVAGLA